MQRTGKGSRLTLAITHKPTGYGFMKKWLRVDRVEIVGAPIRRMLIVRFALYVFSLTCMMCAHSWSAENPKHNAKDNAQTVQADLRGTRQSPFVVEMIPSERSYAKTDAEKIQEQAKAYDDRLIAHSTLALAVVTSLLALFTLGLMVYTGKLWGATRKLVEAADTTARQQALDMRESLGIAKQTADATTKSVKEMRANATHELRAYVSVSLQQVPSILSNEPAHGPFAQIIPILQNSGVTPTRQLGLAVEASWLNSELAASGHFFCREDMNIHQSISVQPRSSAVGRPIQIQESQLSNPDPLYVWGIAEYQDIFLRKIRRTEFCFRVGMNNDGSGITLSFTPYGPHNRADEECDDWPSTT